MSLGEIISQARKSADISLDDLASLTSIRSGLLREMENNNFSSCGGDTYAKGHLRNIAPKIGLDPIELVNQFNVEHSQQHRAIHELLVENSVTSFPAERRRISIKTLAIASIIALTIISAAQIVISNSKTTTIPKPVMTSSSPSPSPSQSEVLTPTGSKEVSFTISAARGNASIEIVVDNSSAYKGKIFQGETKSYVGTKSISIYLSNAGDMDLVLNGTKLAPLGVHNQEVRQTFRLGE